MPTAKKCCMILFCPIVLLYQSIRIYLCGCICSILASVGRCVKICCCTLWGCLCCCCGCCSPHFKDEGFPHTAASLGNADKAVWRRCEHILEDRGCPEPVLFSNDEVRPSDVSQGELGDCWLMAVLAALAVYPETIRRVFQAKRYSSYGKYTLNLYNSYRERWEEVNVDTYIPCHQGRGTPMYAQLEGRAMWPVLLEKAIAKYCGSYQKIEGGHTEWAFATLTGYPTFTLDSERGGWVRHDLHFKGAQRGDLGARRMDEKHTVEDVFYILREYTHARSIIACSSMQGSDRNRTPQGIVFGHAYTLLRAERVDGFLLVQLRNPWGSGEWTGPWGDGSAEWQRHPSVAKELRAVKANDGAFWMSMADFALNFRKVTICARETGFVELALDTHEECGPCCGPFCGCVSGCICFWCGCRGVRALCCGEDAEHKTREGKRPNCCGCYC